MRALALQLMVALPLLAAADDSIEDALDQALDQAPARRTPVVAPIRAEDCARAAAYSERIGGQALLVIQRGGVVYERYYNGYRADTPHRLASGTKSFSGILAARLVTRGLLRWDERVSDTITEWREDPRKSRITVRQLLGLVSGLEPGANRQVPTYAEAIRARALAEPGTRFAYGSVPFQCFGELVRRKLTRAGDATSDPLAYLRREVLDPIGLKVGAWRRHRDGMPQLPSGAFLVAREWAKLGALLLAGGRHEGEVLLAPKALAVCLARGSVQPRYGATFWLADPKARTPWRDLSMAAGKGQQRLYVIPSRQLVIVHLAEAERRFDDDDLLRAIYGQGR